MIDAHGRNIDYLRLSITQRCNLHCTYCNPAASDDCGLLNAEQIGRILRIMAKLGVTKVRLTGGEPLMRADLEDIIREAKRIPGIKDIPITTNGVGLAPRIEALHAAGVTRFNISLDTLQREKFQQITGVDGFEQVWAAIQKGMDMGLNLKLNAVLIRGINDDEIGDFIALAKKYPLEMRFIELMPIGQFGEDNQDKVISGDEILAAHPELCFKALGAAGVAELYTAPGFMGSVGFISPVNHKFCATCNRIRLTADGRIKPCLGDNGEVSLQGILDDDAALEAAIRDAIYNKPTGHCFEKGYKSLRDMKRIGG